MIEGEESSSDKFYAKIPIPYETGGYHGMIIKNREASTEAAFPDEELKICRSYLPLCLHGNGNQI
jgi:hypothetical protein